jgi:3-deoxy-D-manno-octulosonic-acid transferase
MAEDMHILYSAAAAAALVLSAPWWLWRMLRSGKYRSGIAERLGRVPARLRLGGGSAEAVPTADNVTAESGRTVLDDGNPFAASLAILRSEKIRGHRADSADNASRHCVWVHAVSVGEVLAVSGVIAQLRERLPEARIVVSTTTLAGQNLARQRIGERNVFYFPLDFAFCIRPYLRSLQPELIVLAETEFWPNFLRLAKASGARVAVVNARISDRSLPRYRRWRGLIKSVLAHIDLFLAQSEEDRRRLIEIGAIAPRVAVSGNLKFDVTPPASIPLVAQLRAAIPVDAAVIVAGSTMEGEEDVLLHAFKKARLAGHDNLIMVIAPRHPERFDRVAEIISGQGLQVCRRSLWKGEPIPSGLFLLDSIGELASLYSLATIAFVGGSLVPTGGHNILEPAQFGTAIVVGRHTENFRDIVSIFEAADALCVTDSEGLSSKFDLLLSNRDQRQGLGRRALEVFRAHSGATARTVDALAALLAPAASVDGIPASTTLPPPERAVHDASASR